MKKTLSLLLSLSLFISLFSACDKKEEDPILLNSNVTVSNTLQIAADPSMGGTAGVETPIETIFGLPDGTFEITTVVSDETEFAGYLDGLYDIDLSEDQIVYNLVAPADHPTYSNFFRTIEANTFDRYYFKFSENHNINSSSSNNAAVSLRVLSESEIVVEIGEGFSFNPGSTFTIQLN